MCNKKLYIETSKKDNRIFSPQEQESNIPYLEGSDLIEATEQEVIECREYYETHGCCKHHLVYDEDTFPYSSRYCGICGKFIAFI